MKKPLLISLILLIASCSYSYSQQKDSSRVYIMSVEMNLMSAIRVECEDFAYSFPTIMKHRHINNNDSLAMLDSFLKKVKYKKRNKGIDVRGQINYYKPGLAPVHVCFNYYYILINGRLIKSNNKFIDFLISTTH